MIGQGMKYVFDPVKDRANRAKHKTSLAAAERMFLHKVVDFEDDRFDYGEIQMLARGLIDGDVFVCVYVDRGDSRRIISLRKATKHEAKAYFETIQNF
jgi:uncharacterized DUF497 family protein